MPAHDNPVCFEAHLALLHDFIARRAGIVERIRGVLGAEQKPLQHQQDRAALGRRFEDCFFLQPGIRPEQLPLRGQLQQAHWADGFRPRDMPGIPNEMFDPADLITRAFMVWRHTGWPGGNGRVRFAQTMFNVQLVRCLALLVMRVCDAGPAGAGERLSLLQQALGALWKSSPPGQPVLVRDVRWLAPVAQSPTTDELAPYFEAARKFGECLPEADCFEIHKASVLMAGGHLRSQLRYFTMNGRSLAEKSLTLSTRGSNALDCAMTIQHLVPLLAAYETAVAESDAHRRAQLADVICQGISADPELYVNRLDLAGPYSMIEPLFVTATAGRITLSQRGQRHVGLVQEFMARMQRMTASLGEDCARFRPVAGTYSPYGVMYGYSSNIVEHMAMKTLEADAESRFSLEDVFAGAGQGPQRLAWVSGWRRLPHVPQDVVKLYAYPQAFAEEIFSRIELALQKGAGSAGSAQRSGRISIDAPGAPGLPAAWVKSSDPALIEAGQAQHCDEARLLADRQEGMHLVSFQTQAGWVAISKDLLTEAAGEGIDVNILGLPESAIQTLEAMYPRLVKR